MSEEKKEEKKEAKSGVSRRTFIGGTITGLVVGAAAAYGATTMMPAGPKPPVGAPKEAIKGKSISLTVNGKATSLWVDARWSLANTLRNSLGLRGTVKGCDYGECGSCTVIVDGRAMPSCMVLAIDADGRTIQTIEGVSEGGKLSALQETMIKHRAFQCGFCGPGFIMSAKALLDKKSRPTEDEIREALSGNICRCTGYHRIVESLLIATGQKQPLERISSGTIA
jgi:carbon-monoxide dehydrogenase small subunit